MTSSMRSTFLAVAAAGLIQMALPGSVHAQQWQVIKDKSAILWTAKWNTSPVSGGFKDFTSEISFDPEAPEDAVIRVEVDSGSIYLNGQDARSTLVNSNWFFIEEYPKAVFVSEQITHLENGRYEARGSLTIRGHEQPVTLPFKLTIEGDVAQVVGSITLDRNSFSLGQKGDVAKAVAANVNVSVEVTAKRLGD
ncbi:hypothetical protein JCM17846_13460 [Iodidimonas nitroreducens]|uniref:Lipid/polyisoprenoid-binding YceI-like domain-containing protein n=2 Tax=Iodidimonas nitroreducens TaxID=1236968 RepID=A0A5A7N7D3_9PROT|nr:hypothetical protein AQ1_01526 [alpha proteobacterium Q-1]GER03664.1 hypothetical protein JCM17846_13460 [Iodidimonas nitroreducens]